MQGSVCTSPIKEFCILCGMHECIFAYVYRYAQSTSGFFLNSSPPHWLKQGLLNLKPINHSQSIQPACPVSLWVLGSEPESSCLHSKDLTHWVNSTAPRWRPLQSTLGRSLENLWPTLRIKCFLTFYIFFLNRLSFLLVLLSMDSSVFCKLLISEYLWLCTVWSATMILLKK